MLCLDTWESLSDGYLWSREHLDRDRLAEEFLAAPLFNGKSFLGSGKRDHLGGLLSGDTKPVIGICGVK